MVSHLHLWATPMRLISEFNFTVKDIGAQKSKATGLRWRLVMEHGGKHVFLTMYSALFLQWGMLPNKVACASVLSHFSRVWRFATPWAVARQAPLSMWILQARILEWVAIPPSRGSSQPRDWTQVSQCRRILYCLSHQGSILSREDSYKVMICSMISTYKNILINA